MRTISLSYRQAIVNQDGTPVARYVTQWNAFQSDVSKALDAAALASDLAATDSRTAALVDDLLTLDPIPAPTPPLSKAIIYLDQTDGKLKAAVSGTVTILASP